MCGHIGQFKACFYNSLYPAEKPTPSLLVWTGMKMYNNQKVVLLYFQKSIKWTHDLMHRLSCYRCTWLVAHNVYSALIYIMALSFHLLASKQFVNYLLLPIVAAFLLLHQGAYSWPSGAPTLACGTMTPGHFRFSQTTACPFTTSTNAVQIS